MRTLVKLTLFRQFYIMVRAGAGYDSAQAQATHCFACWLRLTCCCRFYVMVRGRLLGNALEAQSPPDALVWLLLGLPCCCRFYITLHGADQSNALFLLAGRACCAWVASSHPCCRPLWHLLLAFPPSPPQVVVYIYFTRIIVYLLESTLPFQLIWLAAAASEAATLAFYVAAGVSFR